MVRHRVVLHVFIRGRRCISNQVECELWRVDDVWSRLQVSTPNFRSA